MELIRAVREQGLEGVIAKRRNSSYQPGKRSGAWVKIRINRGQELVIGGYVLAPNNFDSIVVGYYEAKKLIYVASVRNGFTPSSRETLFQTIPRIRARKLSVPKSPRKREGQVGRGPDGRRYE